MLTAYPTTPQTLAVAHKRHRCRMTTNGHIRCHQWCMTEFQCSTPSSVLPTVARAAPPTRHAAIVSYDSMSYDGHSRKPFESPFPCLECTSNVCCCRHANSGNKNWMEIFLAMGWATSFMLHHSLKTDKTTNGVDLHGYGGQVGQSRDTPLPRQ